MKYDKDTLRKKAIALAYKEGYNAPKVIAKGQGEIAEKIVETGQEEGIAIYEDEKLIENLMNLDLYEEVPPELYEAISEIILFVYSLDKEKGEKND